MTRSCREEKRSIRVPIQLIQLIRSQAVLVVDNRQAPEKILLHRCVPLWTLTAPREESGGREGHAVGGDERPAGPRPPGTGPPGAGLERAAADLLAHRGFASLTGPQREAVLLASCGYTRQQAADVAGVPAETLAGRLREGLLRLNGGPE
jgi:DNA-directed RNA polymerase specialized sigma24 family protein